jgi:hypothetical protein
MAATPQVATTLAMALAGLAFGLVYFATLRRTIALFSAGRGWLAPAALTVGRLAAMAALLALAARLGAAPLLAAFGGVLAARFIALRVTRRTA